MKCARYTYHDPYRFTKHAPQSSDAICLCEFANFQKHTTHAGELTDSTLASMLVVAKYGHGRLADDSSLNAKMYKRPRECMCPWSIQCQIRRENDGLPDIIRTISPQTQPKRKDNHWNQVEHFDQDIQKQPRPHRSTYDSSAFSDEIVLC